MIDLAYIFVGHRETMIFFTFRKTSLDKKNVECIFSLNYV